MSFSPMLQELQERINSLNNELKEKEEKSQLQKKELLLAKDKAEKSEHMLHTLVETAVGTIGQDFFDNIVIKLSEWLDVDCVIIGQMLEPNRIHCLPLYLDGNISHDFSYELSGSPCDITTRKGYCYYPENVIEEFPKDKILTDLNAEGYIGTALYNKTGVAIGVICAVSRKKFDTPAYTEKMLKIIGARVSAEIERKKMEEALKKSETELRESNATKDKFISVIAHDLKSPFNSIIGFSELLMTNLDQYNKQKQKKCIDHIYQTAQNTYALLENLLTWSLSKQGLIAMSIKKMKLKDIVTENLNILKYIAQSKSIELCCDVPEDIFLETDKYMLSTILRNLLANAIKYSDSGDKIQITSRIINTNESSIAEISIIDEGVGIEAENVPRLFRIDQNISTQGTHKEKGTGLGLIICREFVEKLGGSIRVESKPDEGSKFIIILKTA